mmetsp:Transcript_4919/g.13547  ORF Transcript_4919/g.13547 Transcript_4919/m.13547 type:complete len:632 (-) Transcript_4919:543-2438(-)
MAHAELPLIDPDSCVDVERDGHALQDPVARVVNGADVRLHHEADAHGISSVLRHVDGHANGALELELGELDGNDLHDGQLLHEHLGLLAHKHRPLHVKGGALHEKALYVAPIVGALEHLVLAHHLGERGVERGLVQGPLVLAARGLHERCCVRLWDVESREPDHLGLAFLHPALVLAVAAEEEDHPRAEHLLRLRCQLAPHVWQLAVVQVGAQGVELCRHAHLTSDGPPQLLERAAHARAELLPAEELLHEHDEGRRRLTLRFLLDAVHVEGDGHLGEYVCGDLVDVLLAAHLPARHGRARLEVEEVGPQLLGSVGEVVDLCVGVEAKYLGRVDGGHGLDGGHIYVTVAPRGHAVIHLRVLEEVEGLESVEEEVTEVLVEVGAQHAPVEVVGHSPAVHHLASEVAQGIPWDHGVVVVEGLGEVGVEEHERHAEVRVVEVVAHVPAHLAVLAPLLHDCVEEAEHKDTRAEGGVGAALEHLLGHLGVGGHHVQAEAVRGLRDHLDGPLQNTDGELVGRLRREPEAEVGMRPRELEEELLQRLKPRGQQVAVLEHDPVAALRAHVEHGRSDGALALAKGHELELLVHAQLGRELENVGRGVRARGEEEYERRRFRGLVVDGLVVEHGRGHVVVA